MNGSRRLAAEARRALLVAVCGMAMLGCDAPQQRPPLRETIGPPLMETVPSRERPPGQPVQLVDEAAAPTQARAGALRPVVDVGTGQVIAPPVTARAERVGDGEVILNFVDADIAEVARAILADTLGRNYVVDPSVTGTVTLHTSRPMALDELPRLLQAVLELNGAALIDDGDLYRIVPSATAAASGLNPALVAQQRSVGAGYALYAVPLRFIAASEIEVLLQPFLPAGSILQVDLARNLLLISGPPTQVGTALELVQMLDVDWLASKSLALYPLLAADAESMASELEAIFVGESPEALDGVLRFVPIPRLQAVMVIASEQRYLTRVKRWIDELDRGAEADEPGLYIYPVQFGTAANLAEVLRELFQARGTTIEAPTLAPGLEPVTFGSTGFGESFDEPQLDDELGDPLRVVRPRTTARAGGSFSAADRGFGDTADDGLRIAADEVTNSLVIQASPREYRRIREAVEQLDVMPLQVLIDVVVAEVRLQDELRYGLQWFFRFGDFDVRLSDATGSVGSTFPTFPGFAAVFASGSDVRVVLNALESLTDINVISSPQLVVLDNQVARLQVGDQVPIAVQSAVSIDDPGAPIVNTIEQRDTGVILDITPRVNASGLSILQIDQQVSRVTETTTSGIDSPTINQRRLTTTVAIHSGETVALGGLIEEFRNNNNTGLPYLARLPIIGPLFGTRTDQTQRTELLVLLTPRVLYDRGDAQIATDDLRRRLRQLMATEQPQPSFDRPGTQPLTPVE